MKMLKWALLGGAAFAVSATAAQADDLAALKAQLETLQARVSQLESRPAPSVPEGYQLLTVSDAAEDSYRPGIGSYMMGKGSADMLRGTNGTTISILPTADVAPSTQVVVSGQVRTILLYQDPGGAADDFFDVTARGRLVVEGTTETAVGKVFVHLRLQGGDFFDASGNNAVMNEAYGTWEFMPGWQLLAGRIDNTAAVQAGIDWVFNFGGPVPGVTNAGVEQMRLTYTTGPISWAVAVEDTETSAVTTLAGGTVVGGAVDQSDIPSFAGYLMYNQDGLLLQLTGAWAQDDSVFGSQDDFFVGVGADFTLTDMIRFTGAAGFGDGYQRNQAIGIRDDQNYWGVSGGVIISLQEDLSAEIGGAYTELSNPGADGNAWEVTGGLYWTPVDQLTLGWQAEYFDPNNQVAIASGPGDSGFVARFATWFRF